MPTSPAIAWTSPHCAFLACWLACGSAPVAWAEPTDGWADADAEPDAPALLPHRDNAVRPLRLAPIEIAARPTAQDMHASTLRLDLTRWIHASPHGSLGLTLSTLVPMQAETRPGGQAVAAWGADIGVRWRTPLNSRRHLDMSAWTRAVQPGQAPDALGMIWSHGNASDYGARVEMQWSSSRTGGLVPEFGAVGVQLEGQSRLLLRARRGGPMLYYRTKF
jgi:hypothetical protein